MVNLTTCPAPRALTFLKRPVGTRASRSITITRTMPRLGARVHTTTDVSVTSPAATPDENDAAPAGAAQQEREGECEEEGASHAVQGFGLGVGTPLR